MKALRLLWLGHLYTKRIKPGQLNAIHIVSSDTGQSITLGFDYFYPINRWIVRMPTRLAQLPTGVDALKSCRIPVNV